MKPVYSTEEPDYMKILLVIVLIWFSYTFYLGLVHEVKWLVGWYVL